MKYFFEKFGENNYEILSSVTVYEPINNFNKVLKITIAVSNLKYNEIRKQINNLYGIRVNSLNKDFLCILYTNNFGFKELSFTGVYPLSDDECMIQLKIYL